MLDWVTTSERQIINAKNIPKTGSLTKILNVKKSNI